jgi:hypothetical protein
VLLLSSAAILTGSKSAIVSAYEDEFHSHSSSPIEYCTYVASVLSSVAPLLHHMIIPNYAQVPVHLWGVRLR